MYLRLLMTLSFLISCSPWAFAEKRKTQCSLSVKNPTWGQSRSSNEMTVEGVNYRRVSTVKTLHFKNVTAYEDHQGGGEILIEIPEGAESFSINILAHRPANYSYVYKLVSPEGTEIVSPNPERLTKALKAKHVRGQMVSKNPRMYSVFPKFSSTQVPSHPSVKVTSGTWRLQISQEGGSIEESGLRDVNVLVKMVPPKTAKRRIRVLRLNAYLTSGNPFGISKGSVDKWAFQERYLRQLTQFYRSIGIKLVINSLEFIDSSYDNAMFALGAKKPTREFLDLLNMPARDDQLNMFFLKPSNRAGEGLCLFNCGGMTYGSSNVSPTVFVRSSRNPERVIAHELGHSAALDHITVDMLESTLSGRHDILGPEGFQDNLMSPSAGKLTLTSEQQLILLKNGAVTVFEEI